MSKQNKNLIIHILDFDDIKNPLLNAGQAISTYEIGRRLADKGHKITVISSRYPGYKDRTEKGIEYRHIGLGSKNIRLNNIFYILCLPFTVFKIKSDIILECFTAPISTLMSPLFTRVPVMAKPTSFDAERFSHLYHLPFHWIERFGVRFYRYFLSYSDNQETKIRKYNKNINCYRAYEGVDDIYFKITPKNPEYLLYLGRLDINQKGIDFLLRAYAKVSEKINQPLMIAGDGPDKIKIKELTRQLGIEHRVKLIGPAYGEKKVEILSKTRFVIMPSRNEGFGIFALEAMASGLPLIVFDIPNFSWINAGASCKVQAFDIDELAMAMLRMANDDKLIDRMSASCRRLASQYTWEKVADEYENIFMDILDKIEKHE